MAGVAPRWRTKRIEPIAVRIVVAMTGLARPVRLLHAERLGVARIATERSVLAIERESRPPLVVEFELGQRPELGRMAPGTGLGVEHVPFVRGLVTVAAVPRILLLQIELRLGMALAAS